MHLYAFLWKSSDLIIKIKQNMSSASLSDSCAKTNLDDIPDDIQLKLFSFLPACQLLLQINLLSKKYNKMVLEDKNVHNKLWKQVFNLHTIKDLSMVGGYGKYTYNEDYDGSSEESSSDFRSSTESTSKGRVKTKCPHLVLFRSKKLTTARKMKITHKIMCIQYN